MLFSTFIISHFFFRAVKHVSLQQHVHYVLSIQKSVKRHTFNMRLAHVYIRDLLSENWPFCKISVGIQWEKYACYMTISTRL